MTPCVIDRFTHRFGAPANWNEAESGHCAALYVRAEVLDGVPFMRSAWESAPAEAIQMVAGGKLVIGISGDPAATAHPVVNMMIEPAADFEPTFTAAEQRKPDGQRVMRVEMLLAAGHRVFAEGRLDGFTRGQAIAAAVDDIERLAREKSWIA